MLLLLTGASTISFASSNPKKSPDYCTPVPCGSAYKWSFYDNPSSGGTVNGYSSGSTFGPYSCRSGTWVGITAEPATGYGFEDWSGGTLGSSSGINPNSLYVPCPGSDSVTANYGSLPPFTHDCTFSNGQGQPSWGPVSQTSGYLSSEPSCVKNGTIIYNHVVDNGFFANQRFNDTTYWCQYFDTSADLAVIQVMSIEKQPILYQDLNSSCPDCAAFPSGTATVQLVLWENENPQDPGYHITDGIGTANFTANSASTGGYFYWWHTTSGPAMRANIPILNHGDVFNLTATNQKLSTDILAISSQVLSEGGAPLSYGGYGRTAAPNSTFAYIGTYYQDNMAQAMSDVLTSLNNGTYIATNTILGHIVFNPVNAVNCEMGIIGAVGSGAVVILSGGTTVALVAGLFFAGVSLGTSIESC